MKNKIIVTGGTGYLGGVLCRALPPSLYQVIAVGRNAKKGTALTDHGIYFQQIDLATQPQKFTEICQHARAVVHCAALSSPWGNYTDFYQSNVLATQHVIDACNLNRVARLIHISTPAIY